MSGSRPRHAIVLAAAAALALTAGAQTASAQVPSGVSAATKPTPPPKADRALMYASDGMRPDLMERYAGQGQMPTYAALMADGVKGANGMVQAFPPNTGVGWYTMATGTYPSEHGSTNNTYYRPVENFNNRTSFSAGAASRPTPWPPLRSGPERRSHRWSGSVALTPESLVPQSTSPTSTPRVECWPHP